MAEQSLIKQVEQWATKRTASGFYIDCKDVTEARNVQTVLGSIGYKPFVTHFGSEVFVVLYLIDLPKPH